MNVGILSLLKAYYNIQDADQIPEQRVKSLWKPQNKFGFLYGIIQYGEENNIREIEKSLSSGEFQNNEQEFIERLYARYIQPFKLYNGSRCSTPSSSSITSRNTSGSNLVEEQLKSLRQAVWKRDAACLFCWDTLQCEAAHIITEKSNALVPFNESFLFQQAGIREKHHQVQNSLLLCVKCHREYGALKRYVDVVDGKFILKVVNSSNDDQNMEWKRAVRNIKVLRQAQEEDWAGIDDRKAVDADGEMQVFFVSNDVLVQPNHVALKSHKAACHIWRMAGGAEPQEESCPDDDFDAIRMSILKVQHWNSLAVEDCTQTT
jgi:5-methylcytosine-specific restriction endonuclease McrA